VKTQATLFLLFSFLLTAFSPGQIEKLEPPKKKGEAKVDPAKLIGKWEMVKVGGEDQDQGAEGQSMTLILKKDMTFEMVMVIAGEGKIETEGKYKVKKQKLVLKIPGEAPTTPKISFRGENLVLGQESWAEFKKVKAEKKTGKPKKPAAK
jgi:uncharacterized protein (TIGR03066 family)